MAIHQVTIRPLTGKDGITRYDLAISAGDQTKRNLYESLESALGLSTRRFRCEFAAMSLREHTGKEGRLLSVWRIRLKSSRSSSRLRMMDSPDQLTDSGKAAMGEILLLDVEMAFAVYPDGGEYPRLKAQRTQTESGGESLR